jgi:hybrid cluster-associated redox disulfide protein
MITEKSLIGEVFRKYPKTEKVFRKYQLGCLGCPASEPETIKEAALIHGINLESFINDLNKAISEK